MDKPAEESTFRRMVYPHEDGTWSWAARDNKGHFVISGVIHPAPTPDYPVFRHEDRADVL